MSNQISALPDLAPRLLLALKKQGHLTDAAQALGVSQPAASKALQRSEAILGVSLVKRSSRPLVLTAEGELVAEFAQKQAALANTLETRIKRIKKSGSSHIRIASFGASASTHLLPNMVEKLTQHLPDLEVNILELHDTEALQALENDLVDFAMVVQNDDNQIRSLPLANDRLVALVSTESPLAQLTSLSAKELAQESFIMTKSGSEPLIREWFACNDYKPKVKHTVLQLTSILAMVRANMGVSIIAEMAMPASHPGVKVIPLMPGMPRIICLAMNEKGFNSHTAKQVWQLLQRFNKK